MEEEFFEDLLVAGQEVKERHPGVDFENWLSILMKEYPAEIVDALGTNPVKVYSSLEEIWKTHLQAF